MAANQLVRPRAADGFSLVEVMIALIFLTVASVTLLQGFELAFRQYSAAQERWKSSVDLWNRVETLRGRAFGAKEGEEMQIVPGARPLYRQVIETAGPAGVLRWEVLRAEK